MAKYKLTRKALADFDAIGLYSLEQWGLNKAESYLSDLDASFDRLAQDVLLGRNRSEIRAGLLAYPCNSHMIFFRRDDADNVEVLRILHQSMAFDRHL